MSSDAPQTALSTKRCGDIAEMYVTSLLLADPELEVFTTVSDDGHGCDLAIHSARTNRWYGVQVKAATKATSPYVYADRFRRDDDFLVAAVVLDDGRTPTNVYLVPGSAWDTDTSGCLGFNEAGGRSGPYYEVRTTAAKHAEALERYALDRVIGGL